MVEKSTLPAETPGETAAVVGSTPATIQGCRPISEKIQPKELPNSGNSGRQIMTKVSQPCGFGLRSPRIAMSMMRPTRPPIMPRVIMMRKVQ